MRLLSRRRTEPLPGTSGVARVDRLTGHLAARVRPGDIAVIDHLDLDRVSADALVAAGAGAVVNASPSISGRYPNLGPEILLGAGIPLLDDVGPDVFAALRDGDRVRLEGDTLYAGERVLATGQAQDGASIGAAMEWARAGLESQLQAFAANTMEFLLQERDLLLDGAGFPPLRTSLERRHALVVVRGYDHVADLRRLRSYIRDYRPVLIGVDAGAQVLLDAGHRVDLVVGDLDTVSDAVLTSGAEVVVHAHPDGSAPGLARVQDLGVEAVLFAAAGTSEDVALLLADEGGAEIIVAVGTHGTLEEFLDRGRRATASSFLTRLRIGGRLVDAEAVTRLYRPRISVLSLLMLVLACLGVMVAAFFASGADAAYGAELSGAWSRVWEGLRGLL